MEMTEKLKELFVEAWDEMDVDLKVKISNMYCESNRITTSIEANNDDFLNNNFSTPSDAVRAVLFGSYNYGDDFVWFDGYGNLASGSYECDLPLEDVEVISEYYIENPSEIEWCSELSEFFDACEYGFDEDETED